MGLVTSAELALGKKAGSWFVPELTAVGGEATRGFIYLCKSIISGPRSLSPTGPQASLDAARVDVNPATTRVQDLEANRQ